jgi:outer membrane lipoprotein SlyB
VKQGLTAAMLAASALAVAGGCASFAPQDYGYSEARSIESVVYGTIESVRPVRLNEDHGGGVGTAAGAVIGGLLGNSIGHGDGRGIATILGAVGGGVAGNAIEHNATAQSGTEIVVRLDSGASIAVVQGASEQFETGQRVRVLTGRGGSRVEHA